MLTRFPYLFSFLAGASLVFAFEPFNAVFMASVAPAVLFYLLLDTPTRKQHVLYSWAFGIGMFAAGTHWIYYSVHFFGGAHWAFATLLTTLFVIFIALFLMVFGLLTSFVQKQSTHAKLLLLFPAAWVLTEWFRGWFLTGFPWLLLGQSQIDTWLANVAPVTGVLGVSWLNAVLAGCLILLFIGTKQLRIASGVIAAIVFALSFVLGFIHWTAPKDEPITVSMLQGNVAQENKWKPEYKQPTLDMYMKMTEESWKSDLIIWPETAIPDWFSNVSEQVIEPLRSASVVEQSDLLIGGFSFNTETKKTYNSIISITQDGKFDLYSKQHLVPFSEYIPFLEYLSFMENWINLPYDSVGKGTGKTTLDVAGQTAQMSICYEDVNGDEVIRGLPDASMLINLSNDGWFTGSIQAVQHMQIARMRSLETGRYMLRATNNGVSGIIDEKGNIVQTADQYVTTIIKGKAQPFTGSTPYVTWSNWLIITMMFAIFLIGGRFFRKT